MRIVATADWHLSYRAFQRVTPDGLNVRERDVAITFTRLIDRIIAVAPDVVLVGGDVFHSPRPSNPSIVHAFNQMGRLRAALPDMVCVMVLGNHDAPKDSGAGGIMPLFKNLGVHVVDRPQQLRFGELAVFAVPDMPGVQRPPMVPDSSARYNVSVIHGEVAGAKQGAKMRHAAGEIDAADLAANGWDLCAFGHYHSYEEVGPKCWYSGSIDLTSSNPWSELAAPKGFIERDLPTGEHIFHTLPASRRYLDLATIDAHGLGVDDLDRAIRSAVDTCEGGIAGAVVRLVVTNVTKEVGRALNQKALREYRHAALAFQIQLERPEHVESKLSMIVRGVSTPGARAKTVDERVQQHFATAELPVDVDRDRLSALAMEYMDRTRDVDAAVIAEPVPAAEPKRAVA